MEEHARSGWAKKELWLGGMALAATVGLCVAAIFFRDELMSTSWVVRLGLFGVLLVSFLAGSTFSITAIPVPYWFVVITFPSVMAEEWGLLAPVWVGLVAAAGATIGQQITFMIGYGGRTISRKISHRFGGNFYDRAIKWAGRHGSWAVFLMSAVVNPLHLPMTIAIATLRYPPRKFLVFCFLGTAVKSLVLAFGGYFGLNWILSLLG